MLFKCVLWLFFFFSFALSDSSTTSVLETNFTATPRSRRPPSNVTIAERDGPNMTMIIPVKCWTGERSTRDGKRLKSRKLKETLCESGRCMKRTWHGEEKSLTEEKHKEWGKVFGAEVGCGKIDCELDWCEQNELYRAYELDVSEETCCCKGEFCFGEEATRKWLRVKTARPVAFAATLFLIMIITQ